MAGTVQWNNQAVNRALGNGAAVGIAAAADYVAAYLSALIAVPGNGVPSSPGSPPHKQTGNLLASITVRVDRATATAAVWPAADYGVYLEFGTARMAPRPYVRRTALASAGKLAPFFLGVFR